MSPFYKIYTTKALLVIMMYNDVCSNYVFKSIYKLYKTECRSYGYMVTDIWYMDILLWIFDYRYFFVDIQLFIWLLCTVNLT